MSSGEFQKENREKHKKRKRGVNLVKKGGALGIFLAKQTFTWARMAESTSPHHCKKWFRGLRNASGKFLKPRTSKNHLKLVKKLFP